MFTKKQSQSLDSSGVLKKKTLVCSSEAAAISIGIHALLIIFAGSIVAIKYVQKRDAAFAGENIARPKLERRELQMPVKVQNLQKKSSRPKVTSRMASVSQASFSLPDMMGMGDIGGGFDRSGSGDRSLSSMGSSGSLGFGISGINFFGAKSKGEKIVFVIDAQKVMMEDHKGGYFTYKFAKDRLGQMIDSMRSATLFNVMVFDRNETVMFSSKLVPANPANRAALKKWIAPLNTDPHNVENLDDLPGRYDAPKDYDDDRIKDLYAWIRPVQAAMEQKADNIFVLCSGYSWQRANDDVLLEMYGVANESEWQLSKGWDAERIAKYHRHNQELIDRAKQLVEEENRQRRADGKPPKIVQNWTHYVATDLDWDWWGDKPTMQKTYHPYGVDASWIIDYLETVYEYNYLPKKLKKPAIHVVKLIASDGNPIEYGSDGGDRYTFHYTQLKKIPKAFGGRMELLRGADSVEDLIKNNKGLDDE